MPNKLEYPLRISLSHRFIINCVPHFYNTFSYLYSIFGKVLLNISVFFQSSLFRVKYTLQNCTCLQKHLAYSCKALKSSPNIIKSSQKTEKAVLKYSTILLFSIFLELFQTVLYLILVQ